DTGAGRSGSSTDRRTSPRRRSTSAIRWRWCATSSRASDQREATTPRRPASRAAARFELALLVVAALVLPGAGPSPAAAQRFAALSREFIDHWLAGRPHVATRLGR